jgi:G-protein alpha subunit
VLITYVCVGAGESGKSTVLKQMRLIYAQGFSKSEKEEWRAIIFNNILSAFKVILDAMEELGIEFSNKDNDVSAMVQFKILVSVIIWDVLIHCAVQVDSTRQTNHFQ